MFINALIKSINKTERMTIIHYFLVFYRTVSFLVYIYTGTTLQYYFILLYFHRVLFFIILAVCYARRLCNGIVIDQYCRDTLFYNNNMSPRQYLSFIMYNIFCFAKLIERITCNLAIRPYII